MIAALFVDPNGPYVARPNVDPWTKERDARLYVGPHPVIAHPPCHLWTNLTGVNYRRYGGAHNRPGNDGGCFAAAVEAVRHFGGVLEHPAGSYAWPTFLLPRPEGLGWSHRGKWWVCEIWQSAYSHRARKRTWLLYRGHAKPFELNWERKPGTHQCGWFDRNKPTLGKRDAQLSPKAFADVLIRLAENSRGLAAMKEMTL